jgi:hypothetical protein
MKLAKVFEMNGFENNVKLNHIKNGCGFEMEYRCTYPSNRR